MRLTPKDWDTFQHYKDRSPPWIKLHKTLLNNFEFRCLPDASRALAPLLWLLASEYENGVIDASEEKLCFRLHLTKKELYESIHPLVESGFFAIEQDASTTLAPCKQNARLEREEREGEKERDIVQNRFAELWLAYPKRQSRKTAIKAYIKALREVSHETIMAALERAKRSDSRFREAQFTPMLASWLNAGGWADDTAATKTTQNLGIV